MKLNSRLALGCTLAALAVSGIARAADVVIGVPNWPSVNVTAHVLKVIMEDNLGLEVELQNGTNPVVFEAMDRGDMHVHPEVWLPNQSNLHNKFVKERKTVMANGNGIPAFQGMCVPKATAEKHGVNRRAFESRLRRVLDSARRFKPQRGVNFDG